MSAFFIWTDRKGNCRHWWSGGDAKISYNISYPYLTPVGDTRQQMGRCGKEQERKRRASFARKKPGDRTGEQKYKVCLALKVPLGGSRSTDYPDQRAGRPIFQEKERGKG